MSENEFYNRMNADAAVRRKQEEDRAARAAAAEQLHRSACESNRRRRAFRKIVRRTFGCLLLAIGLFWGSALELIHPVVALMIEAYVVALVALEEVRK